MCKTSVQNAPSTYTCALTSDFYTFGKKSQQQQEQQQEQQQQLLNF